MNYLKKSPRRSARLELKRKAESAKQQEKCSKRRRDSLTPGEKSLSLPLPSPTRSICDLPNELLVQILQNMDSRTFLRAREVCHRWLEVAKYISFSYKKSCGRMNPLKNYEIKLRDNLAYFWHSVKTNQFAESLGPSLAVGNVHFIGADKMSRFHRLVGPFDASFFSTCGRFLRTLKITEVRVTNTDLLTILYFSDSLRQVELNCVWDSDHAIPRLNNAVLHETPEITGISVEEIWKQVALNLKSLESLDINVKAFHGHHLSSPMDFVCAEGRKEMRINGAFLEFIGFVAKILPHCGALKSLSIRGLDVFWGIMLKELLAPLGDVPEGLCRISETFSSLRKLEKCHLGILSYNLEVILRAMALHSLKQLSIQFYELNVPLVPDNLASFARYGETLRSLRLHFCNCIQNQFQENSFQQFRVKLPVLEELKLKCFAGHLDFIQGFSQSLRTLTLRCYNEKIQTCFQCQKDFFQKLPKLTLLEIDWTSFALS